MQLGSEVIIAVSDDGRGIDVERVREKATRLGIDTDDLTEDEALQLIFRSGLSTTAFVTDVSGRGVGLDVVRTNVEAVRGRIEVRSELGSGTEFRIVVPITLAVLRCLVVEAGGQRFALPFHRVVLSQAHDPSRVTEADGRPIVWVDDQPVAVSDAGSNTGSRRQRTERRARSSSSPTPPADTPSRSTAWSDNATWSSKGSAGCCRTCPPSPAPASNRTARSSSCSTHPV